MRIVPAILTNDERELNSQLLRLAPHFNSFQIDIQDGIYVPSKTVNYSRVMSLLSQNGNSLSHNSGSKKVFDFHLMLSDYDVTIRALDSMRSKIGLRYIFVQGNFKSNGLVDCVCPSINIDSNLNNDQNMVFCGKRLLDFPAIQIMSIIPGPQGQSFQESALVNIRILKEMGYKGEILIDGSINAISLAIILSKSQKYHPDTLCVGSYFSIEKEDSEIGRKKATLMKLIELNHRA